MKVGKLHNVYTYITNGLRWKGTPGDSPVQPPPPKHGQITADCSGTKFSQVMSTTKDPPLWKTSSVWPFSLEKIWGLMFKYSLYFILCPLYLVLSLNSTEKSLAPSSSHPSELFIHICKIPWTLSAQGWTVPTLYSLHFRCSTFPLQSASLANKSSPAFWTGEKSPCAAGNVKAMPGTVPSQPARKQREQKSSATPSQPSTMDTRKRSLCRDCGCPPLRPPTTTPRDALLGESITQTTEALLWSHLQLCYTCRQYSLSSWTLISGSGTAAPLKQCLQESHPWQHHVQGELQTHPALYLDKRSFLQIGLLYILTPPLIFIKDFLPTLGQTSVLLPSEFEGRLLSLASSGFCLHPLPIQQLKSSHHGFVGQTETKSPQMYLSSAPLLQWHQASLRSASLGKTLQSKKGALWHCHIWSGVTAKKTN